MKCPLFFTVKSTIPDALKADMPPNKWGKVLSATPVVLTVIATVLAGLASSEMTRAQYDRSLAAQLQSKAGDQWNFFQGKKLRGALQNTALDMLGSTAEVRALNAAALRTAVAGTPAAGVIDTEAGKRAVALLAEGGVLKPDAAAPVDAGVQTALAGLEVSKTDAEMGVLLAPVEARTLDDALRAAQAQILSFDGATKPVSQAIDLIEKQLARPGVAVVLRRDFSAARLSFHSRRYDAEARLNQSVASLLELQVRKSNMSADRHYRRSQRFFFAMLAAQMGVVISTLAMASTKRDLLWSVAVTAGAIALAFSIYVYLFV